MHTSAALGLFVSGHMRWACFGAHGELGVNPGPELGASKAQASASALPSSRKGRALLSAGISVMPSPPTSRPQLPLPAWPARSCEVTGSWLPGVWRHLPGILSGCQGPFQFTHWAYSWALWQPGGGVKAIVHPQS